MSDSPQSNPKDVEQGVQSPDEEGVQMNDPQDPHSTGLAYEFEVKEQDRWLPIANGMSYSSPNRLARRPPSSLLLSLLIRFVSSGCGAALHGRRDHTNL
jgi:nuclear transcription Y subunit beta